MAWRTSLGIRSLKGVEAELYLEAMQGAVNYIEVMGDELDVKTGDRIFDSANFQQKAIILHHSLSALLKPEVEAPELTNVLEAGAYFPFAYLKMRLEEEISEEDEWSDDEEDLKYAYRRLLWKAFEEFVRPRWEAAVEEYGERGRNSFYRCLRLTRACPLHRPRFMGRNYRRSGKPNFLGSRLASQFNCTATSRRHRIRF